MGKNREIEHLQELSPADILLRSFKFWVKRFRQSDDFYQQRNALAKPRSETDIRFMAISEILKPYYLKMAGLKIRDPEFKNIALCLTADAETREALRQYISEHRRDVFLDIRARYLLARAEMLIKEKYKKRTDLL